MRPSCVVSVHQDVRAGLKFGDRVVAVKGAGPAAGNHVATDLVSGTGQNRHRPGHPLFAGVPVDLVHHVAFVAHDAPDVQSRRAGGVGN